MQTTKSIIEQIEVMTHYVNGGEVEFCDNAMDIWDKKEIGLFDWVNTDYRIKEQKKTVTIEKWLYKNLDKNIIAIECDIEQHNLYSDYKKVKLIKSYEVEL